MVFKNTYGINEKNYWCLSQISRNTKKFFELNNDIVDDYLIEKICDDENVWSISKTKGKG